MRWGKLQLDTEPTGAERWLVATAVIQAGIRSYYVGPVCGWIMAKSPAWSVKARLKKAGNGWYLLPTQASVTHCRLRFDVYPIDVGDLLRFDGGRVSHVAYSGARHTEILEFLPNGDLAPAPEVKEVRRAWAAFFAANRRTTD